MIFIELYFLLYTLFSSQFYQKEELKLIYVLMSINNLWLIKTKYINESRTKFQPNINANNKNQIRLVWWSIEFE